MDAERVSRAQLGVRLTGTWITFEDDGLQRAGEELLVLRDEVLAAGHQDLAAVCDNQLGTLRGRSGDLTGALKALRRAERGRPLMATADQARLLVNRGTLATQLGVPGEASSDLAEAAQLAHGCGLGALEFLAVHNQGYAEFIRGDLPAALTLMEQADAMDVEVDRGIALLDRARVLLEAGLVEEAHEVLACAMQRSEASGSQHDLGEIELDLARCEMLLGHNESARQRAAAARRRFRRRGESGWRHAAQLIELEARAVGPESAVARARLSSALGEAASRNGDDGMRHRAALVRAEALADLGRAKEAKEAWGEARCLLRSPQLATRLHARHVSARISDDTGRADTAARTLRRAADDLGAAGRQSAGLDLRTALTVHATDLVGLDLDLAMRGGSASRVLGRTELWRDVVRALPPVRTSTDPRRAEVISRLRQAREDLRQAPPDARVGRLRAEVTRVERAVRELDWTTGTTSAQVSPALGPLSVREIRDAVQQTEVTLLSTLIRDQDVYAVLVRPDGRLSLHMLAALPSITARVRSVQADLAAASRLPVSSLLRRAVQSSLAERLKELDATLLAPVTDAGLGDVPLVVVPTPTLMLIPWGMLPGRQGRPTTVARSATSWARRHTSLSGEPVVRAIAGPDVPLADTEVAEVVNAWGSGRAVTADASRAGDVVSAVEECDLVHVAAHGEHHAQNPLFSSLRLSDGAVFAHELEGHRLRASHVVLSACDGGRISVRRGEEPLGLTASLLALGVPTVIAAVSPVPDRVAHAVMTGYHREIAAGVDAATALATASAEGDPLAPAFSCFGSFWRCAKGEGP